MMISGSINGAAINETAINAGSSPEQILNAIKASSEIPISAQKEFEEFMDTLPEEVFNSIENLTQVKLPPELYDYADIFFQIVQSFI